MEAELDNDDIGFSRSGCIGLLVSMFLSVLMWFVLFVFISGLQALS